ncbi:MAG: hypothetical protein ACXWV2_12480 [Chitinophagaceae bacterium]
MKNSKTNLLKIKTRTILTFENNKITKGAHLTGFPDTTTTTFPTSGVIFTGMGKQ